MKLARFEDGRGPRSGLIVGSEIVDIAAAGGPDWDMSRIIVEAASNLDFLKSLEQSQHGRKPLTDVRLLAPIEKPGKYLAIGMNYRSHVEESSQHGISAAAQQMWFNKQTSCIASPFDSIDPGVSKALDYEVELAVVIGKAAKGVSSADALRHVFGYTVANDVSARDWQMHSPTWTVGKSFDTHGPIGPWIVTADEIPDPQALDLRCLVNGELRQSSNTSQMIYSVADQIAYLSTAFTLDPGDLIATGTPDGVGAAMKPMSFLKPGDVVRCEIDGVGFIENRVQARG